MTAALRPSVIALILANAVPLVGVLFLGWQVFPLVLLFWVENLIVGAFNVLKMATAPVRSAGSLAGRFFLIPFFTVHYGMFSLVHGVFVFALFGRGAGAGSPDPVPSFDLVFEALSRHHLLWAVLGLVVSHGVSFVANYLRGGERERAELPLLMQQPYGRIVVLHMAILGGGFLLQALGSPTYGLALLVILKTGLDLRAHLRERRKFGVEEADVQVLRWRR